MELCWGSGRYGYRNTIDDNAVAFVERVFPLKYKLTMRADVNKVDHPLFNSSFITVGEYPTEKEARAVAELIYRLQVTGKEEQV